MLNQPWRRHVPLLLVGGLAIVAGGLTAALARPIGWEHGSWVAAFLVLVAGVAQVGIAICQVTLAPIAPTARFAWAQCALWNAGCIAVLAGTMLTNPIAVSIGSISMAATLAMSARAVWRSDTSLSLLLWGYRGLMIVLLGSIPIGVTLAWTRR